MPHQEINILLKRHKEIKFITRFFHHLFKFNFTSYKNHIRDRLYYFLINPPIGGGPIGALFKIGAVGSIPT